MDFIRIGETGTRELIQVSESLADPVTRNRELAALRQAMREQGIATGTVVTRSEESREVVNEGTITILPIWKFLLTGEPDQAAERAE